MYYNRSLLNIFKNHTNLCTPRASCLRFFINHQKGKCTVQITYYLNKFGAKNIAKYLNPTNPDLYTGQCFRWSSAVLLVDADGHITLKPHGGWKSTSVAESYINDCIRNEMEHDNKMKSAIVNTTNSEPSKSRTKT